MGNSSRSLNLQDVAGSIPIVVIEGVPPGFVYVGEDDILSIFVRLNHSGDVFHFREEETQYYTTTGLLLQHLPTW